jgi:hypothetical protein
MGSTEGERIRRNVWPFFVNLPDVSYFDLVLVGVG